ncbi:MAG TPA: glycosyltransferase [Bryobacteraceae bacterium]|nr:glycosyltransferase [Bryobacteraceae bacterium]
MNIAFFGSSLVSAYWNGAATYYRGVIRALNARGHQITFYEPDAWGRQEHRDIPDPSWARVVVFPATEAAALACVEEAKRADLIVKASGVGIFDELLERAVLEQKTSANMVIFWDVDAPATLDRITNHPGDSFNKLIPRYDVVFTYGGGSPVVKAYKACGARECVPIYNALDPETHFPVAPDSRFAADLAFLGNRLPDREARVDEFFLRPARSLSDRTYLLGGAGWADKTRSPNVRYVDHVYTRDHNAFNSTPLAVLNISRDSMAKYGFSPATRVFEALGAAACMITDHWEGIESFFEPDHEILVARNSSEVIAHLIDLTPQRAMQIGRNGYRRVLNEHTYAHRAAEIDQTLGVDVAV